MSDKPTLPTGGNYKELQAQNKGFRRTRKVTIPASTEAAGVKLNETPLSDGMIMVIWVPKTADGGVDMRVYGDGGNGGDKDLTAWEQDAGTRDVMDAVQLAQSTWRAISKGASFEANVTEIG